MAVGDRKKVHFADTEKPRRQLDQNGIEFVGTKVMAKHLPPSTTSPVIAAKSGRKIGK